MHKTALASLSLTLAATAATATAQSPLRRSRNVTIPPATTPFAFAAGDVDGDGDIDLVVANDHADNQLLLNYSRGRFADATAGRLATPQTPFPSGYNNASYQVDLADIDGDGDLDLLVVNDHDLPNRVYTNNGTGTFTDVTLAALPVAQMEWSISQAVGDFDNDGDVDWFVGNQGVDRLYLNNGTGTFADATASNLPLGGVPSAYHAQPVDLDNDGDLDLVVDGNSVQPTVYVNDGSAVFTPAPLSVPRGEGYCYAADLDGDGMLDLLLDNGRWWHRNLGGLTFGPRTSLPARTYGAVDVDGDGDLDLLADAAVLLNDGSAGFTTTANPDLSGASVISRLTAADVDGDGDRDVVMASQGSSALLANFTTQLETPAAPTIGQSYTIELHSEVTTPVSLLGLGISTAGAYVPLPGLGTLRIDLSQSLLFGPFVATSAVTGVAWAVPASPALAGSQLHLQMARAPLDRPPSLGNAVLDFVQ